MEASESHTLLELSSRRVGSTKLKVWEEYASLAYDQGLSKSPADLFAERNSKAMHWKVSGTQWNLQLLKPARSEKVVSVRAYKMLSGRVE